MAPLPALVWMHDGGMMFGDVEASGVARKRYAAEVGFAIVSVNYRLAPERLYPAAIEDCHAAAVWTAEHAGELGIDVRRIAVDGESAGGGLAAGTALLLRDRGGPRLALQVLLSAA
jgi:acetyl esterase/lipase